MRRLRIVHYPPYTSKWRPIEHCLFSQVESALRSAILDSAQPDLHAAQQTRTQTPLLFKARILDMVYELGRECFDIFRDTEDNFIRHDEVLGKWNYVVNAKGFY